MRTRSVRQPPQRKQAKRACGNNVDNLALVNVRHVKCIIIEREIVYIQMVLETQCIYTNLIQW